MHPRLLVLLAMLAAIPASGAAQAPTPNTKLLRVGITDSLEIFITRQGQRTRTGFVVDRLDTAVVDGETVLRRVYRIEDAIVGSRIDSLIDAYADLRPRSIRSRAAGATESSDFRAGRVTGTVHERTREPRALNEAIPETGWYSSASFDLILRASPLADGYTMSVPSFSGRQGAATINAKVVGSETVEGFGDTWRVDAEFPGLPVTFWVTKDTRQLVRQNAKFTAAGVELLFVMVKKP